VAKKLKQARISHVKSRIYELALLNVNHQSAPSHEKTHLTFPAHPWGSFQSILDLKVRHRRAQRRANFTSFSHTDAHADAP
jgi:hypothetical protein